MKYLLIAAIIVLSASGCSTIGSSKEFQAAEARDRANQTGAFHPDVEEKRKLTLSKNRNKRKQRKIVVVENSWKPVVDFKAIDSPTKQQYIIDSKECGDMVSYLHEPNSIKAQAIRNAEGQAILNGFIWGRSDLTRVKSEANIADAMHNPYSKQNEGMVKCLVGRGYSVLG